MRITARKQLSEALRPVLYTKYVITRCVRRNGLWFVYAMPSA